MHEQLGNWDQHCNNVKKGFETVYHSFTDTDLTKQSVYVLLCKIFPLFKFKAMGKRRHII